MPMTARHVQIPRRVEPLLRAIGRLADERGMRAYAVGGCVRDWLFGLIGTPDLDVTVEGDGIAVAQAAARALGGTLTVHRQFGTATQRLRRQGHGGRPGGPLRVDFATCRRETYARPAAYPKVAAGTLGGDLFRRDFTINAIAAALGPARFGALADPFHGARDLRQRCLRVLHARSFLDDPSRLLRGIRFAHRFGLRWEPATRRAAREAVAAGALGWLNAGRLRRELDRMREEPDPLACYEELAALLNSSSDAA